MIPNSTMFKAAAVLIGAGVGLVLANWYTKPDAALAWTAALVMFGVMSAALGLSRRAIHRSTTASTAARGLEQIAPAVVFAGLIMGIPLALTLGRAHGFVDGLDIARRSTGVLTSVFLVMLGNVMPKHLPPLSPGCDGARQQSFHRLAGWTWVISGLASAAGWVALPIDAAEVTSVVLVMTAISVTVVHVARLARGASTTPSRD